MSSISTHLAASFRTTQSSVRETNIIPLVSQIAIPSFPEKIERKTEKILRAIHNCVTF